MEKILLVLNAHRPNLQVIDFACQIAGIAQTRITGLFIENRYFDFIPEPDTKGVPPSRQPVTSRVPLTRMDTEQAIQIFTDKCRFQGIPSEVQVDHGEPVPEILYESRFADLLVIDPELSFYETEQQLPTRLVREVLTGAECPVLLAPQQLGAIDEVVFCYDGSASSVFAIKQFTYLLPELADRKVQLLQISKDERTTFNESHRRMLSWLRYHYENVEYQVLHGTDREELFSGFFVKTGQLAVLGAYGRPALAGFLRRSSAEVLIRNIDIPVFITHH